jgi:hypothetical protein
VVLFSGPGRLSYSFHTDHVSTWLDSVHKSTLLLCMRASRKSSSPGKELPLSITLPTSSAHRVSQRKGKRKAGFKAVDCAIYLTRKSLDWRGNSGG